VVSKSLVKRVEISSSSDMLNSLHCDVFFTVT
jgi:hypothetical protein